MRLKLQLLKMHCCEGFLQFSELPPQNCLLSCPDYLVRHDECLMVSVLERQVARPGSHPSMGIIITTFDFDYRKWSRMFKKCYCVMSLSFFNKTQTGICHCCFQSNHYRNRSTVMLSFLAHCKSLCLFPILFQNSLQFVEEIKQIMERIRPWHMSKQ